MGLQNSTSILKTVITPLGKLFPIISYMIYLSLLRSGIDLLIRISPLIVHLSQMDLYYYCTSTFSVIDANFAATMFSTSLVFWLYVDPSVVGGGRVVVE